jgi:subtilase family serine protease
MPKSSWPLIISSLLVTTLTSLWSNRPSLAAYHFSDFNGRPPIHQLGGASSQPRGLTPAQIKNIYHLPATGGQGIIAIITAYDDPTIEADLNAFSKKFQLPACTSANGCFKKHLLSQAKSNGDWSLETSLDVEWAHAIAPQAKILLVAAATPSGANLLKAIDYAQQQARVVAISMSWGGAEFPEELTLDQHFKSANKNITWFASSGDNGNGVSWPAVSPQVVAVGGTSLNLSPTGQLQSETAWSGSGGGVSAYEFEPDYQKNYAISRAQGHRAIPDVSYNADPTSGFAVYYSGRGSKNSWFTIGGTSAGAPQWAGIKALGLSADNHKFYSDKASAKNGDYFRDIKSGSNGDCGYYCTARQRYDYVTGLGSPLTTNF